jgi:hypothetical protein
MDDCSRLLESAVVELSVLLNHQPARFETDPVEQARLLKTSIGRARQLLESAEAFYTNWIRYLGACCAGYTDEGQPGTLDRGARLLARG